MASASNKVVEMEVIKKEPEEEPDSDINVFTGAENMGICKMEPKHETEINLFLTEQDLLLNGEEVSYENVKQEESSANGDEVSVMGRLQAINNLQSLQEFPYHAKIHHALTDFKCTHCDFITKHKRNLKLHINARHGSTQFKCTKCDFVTKWKTSLKPHMNVRHGSTDLKCVDCDYVTKNKRSLKSHMNVRHGSTQFKCTECDFITKWKTSLKLHMNVRHGSVQFKCAHCVYVTKWKISLKAHMKVNHGMVNCLEGNYFLL